ncbi:valine--tRNA ligase [Rubrimonas cliftonensis]|uniref:Valine--tRNA ligase n=1 Tax=Rubrimonas cliftonensis TaxID=89524 RepID=A0A1H3W3R9_9RHOB|nr:valine--tRNA ligase [Rubrimonas cliftonensis]SDZ81650.1 valyl-tRNA synthetase [Rubrimonas cliftonensis]
MTMEKTFDAAEAEPRLYARWEREGCFRAGANARPGAEPYAIMIPPPNVTGSLHMGHALNNTLQDILIRRKRMQGFDVLWQPGQDHAGIATQMVVERALAQAGEPGRREMGREAFVERVWRQKDSSGDTIINQLKRLGASCDWSRNAFTLGRTDEDQMSRAVIRVFKQLYDEGLIYRGKRLVNWDPHFETAISDLEVENVEVEGHMWHFKYPLAGGETYDYVEKDADGNVTLRETRDYIAIATTRPETMLGDGAVAVHPSDERYAAIVGKLCEIPVGPKEHRRLIPIITDEYPDPAFGSGAVKITGAHDFNDYGVAKRGGIPCFRLMDTKAAMRADGAPYAEEVAKAKAIREGGAASEAEIDAINLVPDEYRGLDRFDCRKRVVAAITGEGLAVTGPDGAPLVENKPIMQPFGDRSKVVIEPMLTDQWFVDAATLAKPALAAVRDGRTTFHPENWSKTYFQWLENIEPWCISRQLWWGHRVPVYYGPERDGENFGFSLNSSLDAVQFKLKLFCAETEAEAIEQAKAYYGSEWQIKINRSDDKRIGISLPEDRSRNTITIARDPDVLDTWFSSALWPFSTLGWPDETPELNRYYPTSVLSTGFDIIFFWVARMMMMGLHFQKDVPFSDVYIHALVRDEQGRKMSKSLGNVIDPITLIDQYGADAVRMTLAAMASMGRDLKLDVSRVEGYRNFSTKLWNAARFCEMNGCALVPGFDPKSPREPVNRWIVGETARLREAMDAAIDAYRFNDAANAAYAHVWGVLCDWYVECAKPLLQGDDGPAKEETRATAAWALDQALILLHPIMPFVTEELYGALAPRERLLVHADWPTWTAADLADAEADADMGWAIAAIEATRSARAEMNVNPGAQIPLVAVGADAATAARLARVGPLLARLARLSSIEHADAAPKGAVTLAVQGATLCLPLAGVIDIAAEGARLEKALGKLDKERAGLEAKLANPAFVEKAKPEVVEKERARLAALAEEAGKLAAAQARLAELA